MAVTKQRGISRLLVPGIAVLEDFSDRLNHVWTFGLLLLTAALIGWRQQGFNDPIVCALPSQFMAQQVAYAHSQCWASNQYYVLVYDEPIPMASSRVDFTRWLYKWLPIILVIQALLFKLPNIVLTVLHGYSGISFEKIAGLTKGYSQLNLTERTLLGRQIGRYVYNWCSQCENCLPWRLLTLNWLLVKVMYVCNALVQLILVNRFLMTEYHIPDNSTNGRPIYGKVIYDNLFNKNSTEWKSPEIFPRTVMCDYAIRQFNNVHRYTHQCDLPINEFNEHIYMVLWIWLLLVTIFSCLSLIVWFLFTLIPYPRQRYVTRMLSLYGESDFSTDTARINRFSSFVGEDGVIVLKLIASNSSELLAKDAVSTMLQCTSSQHYPGYMQNPPEVMQYPTTSVPNTGQVSVQMPDKPPNYQSN